jgi:hypothetical protein
MHQTVFCMNQTVFYLSKKLDLQLETLNSLLFYRKNPNLISIYNYSNSLNVLLLLAQTERLIFLKLKSLHILLKMLHWH